ncbi:hypothetical protein BDQ17DRAFT_1436118 [Cyathus striatus]|nr:hypothetical protein BDQ17DRAFT_1436118 [Cyathus striatus]
MPSESKKEKWGVAIAKGRTRFRERGAGLLIALQLRRALQRRGRWTKATRASISLAWDVYGILLLIPPLYSFFLLGFPRITTAVLAWGNLSVDAILITEDVHNALQASPLPESCSTPHSACILPRPLKNQCSRARSPLFDLLSIFLLGLTTGYLRIVECEESVFKDYAWSEILWGSALKDGDSSTLFRGLSTTSVGARVSGSLLFGLIEEVFVPRFEALTSATHLVPPITNHLRPPTSILSSPSSHTQGVRHFLTLSLFIL